MILFSRFLLTNVDKRAFEQESDLSGGLLQFSDKNCRLFQTGTFLATEGLYCELLISAIDVNYSGTCNVVTEHPNRGLETRPLKALFIKTSRATLSESFRIYFLEIIVFRDRECVQTASQQTRHQSWERLFNIFFVDKVVARSHQSEISHGSYKGTDVRLFSCLLQRAKVIVLFVRSLSVAVLTKIWLNFILIWITALQKPLFSHS